MWYYSTCMIGHDENTVEAADYNFSSAYNFSKAYGSSACVFSIQDNDPRIYYGTYGKIASSDTKYRTIGWKANLYLNGAYQQSVYYSLNGGYIIKLTSQQVDGNEYNLYYIRLNDLRNRFSNQAAINSGAGVIKLDAIMTVVSGSKVLGSCDDYGNYTGEVYGTEASSERHNFSERFVYSLKEPYIWLLNLLNSSVILNYIIFFKVYNDLGQILTFMYYKTIR